MTNVWINILEALRATSMVEWIGTISGLIAVWLSVRANIWSWPIGIVCTIAYIIVFFQIKLYADTTLQVFFLVTNFYGWWFWLKGGANKTQAPISKLSVQQRLKTLIITILAILLSGYLFSRFTDAHIPFWDSTASGLSVAGQILLMRKKLECWIIWIVVDILSVGIYIYKDIYLTAFLYFVFLCMAIRGHYEWKKKYKAV